MPGKSLSRSIETSSNHSFASWVGHPQKVARRRHARIDNDVLALSVTVTLALLVMIGVPLGAILPRKYVVPLPVNILVPFYVYPNPGAWDRLLEACIRHPATNFTVILSIDHGPGNTAWPSGIYIKPIERLNSLPNVRTIGYVDTAYGSRDQMSVVKEIETYAGWENSSTAISGIFFDHTPAQEADNARAYLKNVSATVRHSQGFREPSIVVHNPGNVPSQNMISYHADITIIFDGEFKNMPDENILGTRLRELSGNRQDYAEVIHSMPRTISRGDMRKAINRARKNVGWLYITDRVGENKFECYSDRWEEFLDLTW